MTERSLIVMKKRAIAILLAIAMMVTFMPAMAFAETGDPVEIKSTADIDALIIGQMDNGVQKLADLLEDLQQYNEQINKAQEDVDAIYKNVTNIIDTLQDADKDQIEALLRQYGSTLDENIKNVNRYAQSIEDDMAETKAAYDDFVAKAIILRDFLNEYSNDFTPDQFEAYLNDLRTKLDELGASAAKVRDSFSDALDVIIDKLNVDIKGLGDDMPDVKAALEDMVAKAVILKNFLDGYRDDFGFTPEEFEAYLEKFRPLLDDLSASFAKVRTSVGDELSVIAGKLNQYIKDLSDDMPDVKAALEEMAAKTEAVKALLGQYSNDFTPEEFAAYLENLNKALDDMEATVAGFHQALVDDIVSEIEAFKATVGAWQAKGEMAAQFVLDRTSKYYELAVRSQMAFKVLTEQEAAIVKEKFDEAQAKLKDAVDAWAAEKGYDVKVKEAMSRLMEKNADLQLCIAQMQQYGAEKSAEAMAALEAALEKKVAAAQAALQDVYEAMVEESAKLSAGAKAALIDLMQKASDLEAIKAKAEAMKAEAAAEAAALEAKYEELKAQMKEHAKEMSLKEKAALEKKIIEAKVAAEKAEDKAKDIAKEINKEVAKVQAAFIKAADNFKDQLEDMVAEEIGVILSNVTAAIPEVLDKIDKVIAVKDDILDLVEDLVAYAYGYAEGDSYISISTKLFEAEATIADLEEQLAEAQEVAENAIADKEAAEKARDNAEKAKKNAEAAASEAKKEAAAAKKEAAAADGSYDKLVKNVKKAKKIVSKQVALKKKATKNIKKRKIVVKWKKLKGVKPTRYQVSYKIAGKKNKAKKVLVKAKNTKKVLKKLKKGKTYIVKVRAMYKMPYKNSKTGKTSYIKFYSKWSKSKKIKVTK
jgi:ABC-type transporter Mla subunit MlaD